MDPAARLADAVASVRAGLAARYPVVVDTTTWAWDGGLRQTGGVLVPAMADAYADAIAAAVGVGVRPPVLSDLAAPFRSVRWAELTAGGPLDLFRDASGDDLQTQWSPPAALRRFADGGGRALVQLPDGTLGWVAADRLAPLEPDSDPWAGIRRPLEAAAVPAHASLDAAAERARRRLGRPYRWGGNTEDAADCSGLVQSVIVGASGVLLPKNTADQRRCGERVARGAIRPGDLLFVVGRGKRLAHVGLVLDGPSVVHSCLSRNRVIEEPLADFLDRYEFTAARRPVAWNEPRA